MHSSCGCEAASPVSSKLARIAAALLVVLAVGAGRNGLGPFWLALFWLPALPLLLAAGGWVRCGADGSAPLIVVSESGLWELQNAADGESQRLALTRHGRSYVTSKVIVAGFIDALNRHRRFLFTPAGTGPERYRQLQLALRHDRQASAGTYRPGAAA